MSSLQPPAQLHEVGGRRAWAVWGTAIGVYVLAIFFRSSLGVAGLHATDRFGITASQLATFTVLQLGVYAAMQVPVGVLLDRFGSRRLLLTGLTLMTVGQAGFALTSDYALALATRGITGVGDSMVFVSILRLVGLWFPAGRTPLVSQLTGQAGLLGSIAATVPLTYALATWGWTHALGLTSLLALVVAAGVVGLVKDSPWAGTPQEAIRVRAAARGVWETWRTPGTRMGMWSHFTSMFGPATFGLLWGYPFLVAGEGLTPTTAGTLLIVMTVVSAIAAPVIGRFTSRFPIRRSQLVLTIVATIALAWAVLLAWPGPAPMALLVLVLAVTAVGGPGSGIAFDMARAFNPAQSVGRALGVVNVGGFLATLLAIGAIGVVLDWRAPGGPSTYTLTDFRVALSVQFLFWGIGAWQIWRYRRRTIDQLSERPEALAALREGALLLPGISTPASLGTKSV